MNRKAKQRYSIPARIIELLYTDDAFFNEVIKLKKAAVNNKFPKSDEWGDADGFHLSFALAGYAPEDVSIEVEDNILTVWGEGMDSLNQVNQPNPETLESDEFYEESMKEMRPRLHIGSITRGIARRKFCVRQLISEEFDLSKAEATMEHGLLHILIPNRESAEQFIIEIKNGRSNV